MDIVVSAVEWAQDAICDFNREQLNNFLINNISKHITKFEEIQKTYISLPSTLTKSQRHNIHRFSINNEFDTISHLEDEDRFIEITLSKNYVKDLFKGFDFQKIQNLQQEQPKSEREKLFDTLIGFLNTNLSDLFEKYLDTI